MASSMAEAPTVLMIGSVLRRSSQSLSCNRAEWEDMADGAADLSLHANSSDASSLAQPHARVQPTGCGKQCVHSGDQWSWGDKVQTNQKQVTNNQKHHGGK